MQTLWNTPFSSKCGNISLGKTLKKLCSLSRIQFKQKRKEEELEPKCEKKIDAVREALLGLYSGYASKALESYNTSGTSGVGGCGMETINENDEFEEWAKDMSVAQPNKNEMDAYIEEGRLKGGDNKFNVLDWWKANSLKFPILSHMARDILAIPASTVASESSFSAGGRVLNRRRSSLKPRTVEALLCTGNWLRQELDIHSTINDDDSDGDDEEDC